jgi:hypothetical protein
MKSSHAEIYTVSIHNRTVAKVDRVRQYNEMIGLARGDGNIKNVTRYESSEH